MSMADAIVASYKRWERKPADLYPTPVDATESIIPLIEAIHLDPNYVIDGRETLAPPRRIKKVWEPACGDGRLSRVLEWHGMEVTSSDLREFPGYGNPGVDFLKPSVEGCFKYDAIITNPPFSHAKEFLVQARKHAPVVIFLLKQNYWNTKGRLDLWDDIDTRPNFFLPITWRLAFLKAERGNSPLMDCAWCVWIDPEIGYGEECFFEPVRKIVYPGYHDKGLIGAMAGATEAVDELAKLLIALRS
jgi:hypothetical protein